MYTKAEDVEQAYYDAAWGNNSPRCECYALAVDAAHSLGGTETYNTNDNNSLWAYAPTRIFVFDDSSSAYVTVSGVYVNAHDLTNQRK